LTARSFAEALAPRDLQFRTRGVQVMLLCALVLHPLPESVAEQLEEYARELGVEEGMVTVAREFAAGSLELAAIDFERNGYASSWAQQDDAAVLHSSSALPSVWAVSATDESLARQWAALEQLRAGTLGRRVWELYQARGFHFPGRPGSAPPLLAQHDWVHVLADYGTTVESEVEVFGLIARANDDMRAFSLLAMVISLFETGYLQRGAGLFESSPGHLSENPQLAGRLADAMRRGALCHDCEADQDSVDFLHFDWFSVAHLDVEQVRARFSLPPKSDEARAAGSVSPWAEGGISPFQLAAGRALADTEGRVYDPYGASP
jgi:hypothetical protein